MKTTKLKMIFLSFWRENKGIKTDKWLLHSVSIVLILITGKSAIGQNLVPNSDFETFINCPTDVANMTEVAQWSSATSATPDYYNVCATNPMMDIPTNFNGNETPHSGNAYAGIVTRDIFSDWMEYITIQLSSPLVAGTTYTVSFWASCAEDDNGVWSVFETMGRSTKLAAYLSANDPTNLGIMSLLSGTPQVSSSGTVNQINGWTEVTTTYIASGGEQYITIGNWDAVTIGYGTGITIDCGTAYYYIDDVSVIPINAPTEPTISATVANATCFGACNGDASVTVTGGLAPYTYVWSGNPSGQGTPEITDLCAGTYSITVTDANGDLVTTDLIITESPEITASASSTPVTNCSPANGTATVLASGGTGQLTYLWNPTAATTTIITGLNAGDYSVLVTDALGCNIEVTTNVTSTVSPLSGELVANITEGCSELCVTFSTTATDIVSFGWNFGDGGTSNLANPTHCFSVAGDYSVSLQLTDLQGCVTTLNEQDWITVYPIPVASFDSEQITSDEGATFQFTNLSTNGTSSVWDFGDAAHTQSTDLNPAFTYDGNANSVYCIHLTVTNEWGCVDETEECVELESEFYLYVPNAFTPDGDAFNNTFQPVLNGGFDPNGYALLIYDRWGELLFESYDAEIGWDGSYGGKLVQDGIYTWQITVKVDGSDFALEKVGHLSIIR